MSHYRDQLEVWLKRLDVEADRVLDMGGSALPVKDRVGKWSVKEYKIADNGLEDKGYDYYVDLNESNPTNFNNSFDIVFCLEVMEYVYNPVNAIRLLNNSLNKHGILYITFQFVYPNHNPYENDYLRYTKFGCIKLLESNGFEIKNIVPRRITACEKWDLFVREEKFKAKGAITSKTYYDLGYIVTAKKC